MVVVDRLLFAEEMLAVMIVVPLAGVALCLLATASILIRGAEQPVRVDLHQSTSQLDPAVSSRGSLAA